MEKFLIYLNEPLSKERKETSFKELEGIDFTPIEGHRMYVANTGCSKAHFDIAKIGYRKKLDSVLIFEDDIKILDKEKLLHQIEQAEKDISLFDVYYFSFHPPNKKFKIVGETEHHYQIEGMAGTHCVLYNRNAMKVLLKSFDSLGFVANQVNVDIAIRDNLNLRCFCPKEIVSSFYDGPSTRVLRDYMRKNVTSGILEGFDKEVLRWKQRKIN